MEQRGAGSATAEIEHCMSGALGLTTPKHLLEKLHADFAALKASPDDSYLGFNFFFTAEHLPDWFHPGSSGRASREALRASDPLLQITSHLANGLKHFDLLSKHHTSILGSGRAGNYFSVLGPMFQSQYFGRRALIVELDATIALAIGKSPIDAVELAEKVLAYWDTPGRID
jgi:hypothetical protein